MKKRKTHKQKHLGGVTLEASLYVALQYACVHTKIQRETTNTQMPNK